MSAVSLPVTRPTGRALIVGQPPCRSAPVAALVRLGFGCTEVDEPYDAMAQLSRRPLFYSAVILSLNSLYREELQMIPAIKRRFSHIEIWLSDTDGRQAALAEAVRLGADGLIADDGLHRIAAPMIALPKIPSSAPMPVEIELSPSPKDPTPPPDRGPDPLLTAEELRALLQESPTPGID
jgi:hypothetical protein